MCDWASKVKCIPGSGGMPAPQPPTAPPTTRYTTRPTTRYTPRPTTRYTTRPTYPPATIETTRGPDIGPPSGTSHTVDTGYKVCINMNTLLLLLTFLILVCYVVFFSSVFCLGSCCQSSFCSFVFDHILLSSQLDFIKSNYTFRLCATSPTGRGTGKVWASTGQRILTRASALILCMDLLCWTAQTLWSNLMTLGRTMTTVSHLFNFVEELWAIRKLFSLCWLSEFCKSYVLSFKYIYEYVCVVWTFWSNFSVLLWEPNWYS